MSGMQPERRRSRSYPEVNTSGLEYDSDNSDMDSWDGSSASAEQSDNECSGGKFSFDGLSACFLELAS